MSEKTDNLSALNLMNQMTGFGLNKDEVHVYFKLIEKGISNPLELSRELKISRTRIYALLEKLIKKGFVKEQVRDYGSKYLPEDPSKFAIVIKEKELQLERLKNLTPRLYEYTRNLSMMSESTSKIYHYRGKEGLKQVTWNSLATKDILRIYEIDLMHAFLDYEFSEKMRLEFGLRKYMKVHQLTDKLKFADYTKIKSHVAQWTVKHIRKNELAIIFEIMIYNDVVCMYEFQRKDVFIVEIHNQRLADMQKQIFDIAEVIP